MIIWKTVSGSPTKGQRQDSPIQPHVSISVDLSSAPCAYLSTLILSAWVGHWFYTDISFTCVKIRHGHWLVRPFKACDLWLEEPSCSDGLLIVILWRLQEQSSGNNQVKDTLLNLKHTNFWPNAICTHFITMLCHLDRTTTSWACPTCKSWTVGLQGRHATETLSVSGAQGKAIGNPITNPHGLETHGHLGRHFLGVGNEICCKLWTMVGVERFPDVASICSFCSVLMRSAYFSV